MQPDETTMPEPHAAARGKRRAPGAIARMVTIAIDAGHGGEDPGAIGRRGTQEKDVVLRIAQLLRERVNAEPNMRAYMTRDGDFFVPLGTRVAKARRVQADLFVSIHADAVVRAQASGASVYVLSDRGALSSTARWLADRENASDRIGGVYRQPQPRGAACCSTSHHRADPGLEPARAFRARRARRRRRVAQAAHRAGRFAVLKAPDIPSIRSRPPSSATRARSGGSPTPATRRASPRRSSAGSGATCGILRRRRLRHLSASRLSTRAH